MDDNAPSRATATVGTQVTANLALQIAHNLRFAHDWTELRIHYEGFSGSGSLPRPVISGLPPKRLYVHPDEQIELLEKQRKQGSTKPLELAPEREWVLPSQLHEQWTLGRFAEVFDALDAIPSVTSDDRATGHVTSHWRTEQPKRLLLATIDTDSTVVYYVLHNGIVKPRQN
ncbi:hypothetical protein BAUCODRAFT_60840 [Baudoinia panamericana UAMH 10762]|uniref:tRNA-splicing endonuclease subunit Sen15 domain-containing protein n=1 Tax=Baudoinia panamericana (strain UAMH 10762) TaxID=717646 RepID=M2MUI8_BAUPA|nr:uncharacterized protein BAUCODRAFT_60840 [Baudoinia panamericana UAMH 10762]EMD00587.1 hypothetical protein BAUCODRAFT_60840 [Baudoinia panamericana UAMH 10762]